MIALYMLAIAGIAVILVLFRLTVEAVQTNSPMLILWFPLFAVATAITVIVWCDNGAMTLTTRQLRILIIGVPCACGALTIISTLRS